MVNEPTNKIREVAIPTREEHHLVPRKINATGGSNSLSPENTQVEHPLCFPYESTRKGMRERVELRDAGR